MSQHEGSSSSGPEKDAPQQDADATEDSVVMTTPQDPAITGLALAFVVSGLALAMFLIALDTTIVATVWPIPA